jgi:hypothetical protein
MTTAMKICTVLLIAEMFDGMTSPLDVFVLKIRDLRARTLGRATLLFQIISNHDQSFSFLHKISLSKTATRMNSIMAKKQKATGKKNKNKNPNSSANGNNSQQPSVNHHHDGQGGGGGGGGVEAEDNGGGFLYIDPARIRFQHSRIRPYFSGCGRSVVGTLESIRRGEITPDKLPPIQVIQLLYYMYALRIRVA